MKPVSWAFTASLLGEREGKRQAYGGYLIKVRKNIKIEKLAQWKIFLSFPLNQKQFKHWNGNWKKRKKNLLNWSGLFHCVPLEFWLWFSIKPGTCLNYLFICWIFHLYIHSCIDWCILSPIYSYIHFFKHFPFLRHWSMHCTCRSMYGMVSAAKLLNETDKWAHHYVQ